MIKVEIQGVVFHCDTPQQAVEIAKLMAEERPGSSPKAAHAPETRMFSAFKESPGKPAKVITFGSALIPNFERFKSPATAYFLSKIIKLPETEVNSVDFAKALDVKSPTGIGPRLAKIQKHLAELDPPIKIDDLIERDAKPGQAFTYRVRPKAREIWIKLSESEH